MQLKDIKIKETTSEDLKEILEVEKEAFGSTEEAKLTSDLLADKSSAPVLSLLAFYNEKAIGHILFTRAYINELETEQKLFHILAPLAVIPAFQKKGIGGLLINDGLKRLKEMGSAMVFVLGHIDYYPRHGFIPDAKNAGYPAPYPIPEEVKDAWMFQTLGETEIMIEKGKVICANAMNKPEYWRE